MARITTVTQVKPELVKLTGEDLTVLDLVLSHCISNWESDKSPVRKGPFASEKQTHVARSLHGLVLRIKKDGLFSTYDPEDLDEDEDDDRA